MAILNNLIVHGRSRFLNGINANTINAKSIGANKGVFNELIATTLDVETATIDDLTAQNATVVGLLDVRGELKTNTWSNSNIATIEGNFFIAPTLASGTGETLVSGLTISFASNNWTITITGTFDLNQIGADPVDSSDTATNQWSVGSKVLITGEIGKTDGIYPLGTLMGEIQAASTSSFTITKVTDNLGKTDILSTLGTGTYQYRNVKISLTQRKYGSSSTASDNMRPIGILMSAQGRSSKSFIDIYGGANNLRSGTISGATTDFGGLAIPNVRIGNLRGLPNVISGDFTQDESLPTGWGIYTDNGYFKGTIVANSGTIGGWNIGTDVNKSLYSGTFGTNGSVYLSKGYTSSIPIANSNYLSGSQPPIEYSETWAITAGNSFGVTTSGKVYSISGRIGGFEIKSDALYTEVPPNNALVEICRPSSANQTAFSCNYTAFGAVVLPDDRPYFRVTGDGHLYAQGADITGTVNATSFSAKYYNGSTLTRQMSLDGNGLKLMDGSGTILTQIDGSASTIGKTSGDSYNINITDSAIDLRYNTDVLNKIDSTGMTLKNSSGSTLAEFKSYINLGTGHTNTYTGSAAMGIGLTATKANQIVVGRYNESNTNATFIVGDGTSSSDKSNLLTVGNIAGKQITDTFIGDGETKTFTLSNTPTSTPTIIPDESSTTTYTVSSWSGTSITLNTKVVENEQIQFQYTTNEKGGYLVVGNASGIHGKGAIIGGDFIHNSTIIASGNGASIHGDAASSIMTASGNGASIHGTSSSSTMTASSFGALIYGYAASNSIMTVSGTGASIYGYAYRSTITASKDGTSIHGYAKYSTMTASYYGASIRGYAANSTMTASNYGASVRGLADSNGKMTAFGVGTSTYGYATNNSTMKASDTGSSIHGYASNNSTMTASYDGASIYGSVYKSSTMTASKDGASIHGYASDSSTMTASNYGASVRGHAYKNSTIEASGTGSSIHGYTYDSTLTASGTGSSIHVYAVNSTMTASGNGILIHGYVTNSTMTASGEGASISGYASSIATMMASGSGSLIHGYAVNSTMTASNIGSIALNEATHALARAQLAIGTYNEDDSTTTTTHPSGTVDYGTYAFIIGNGTSENVRSNALTVDWNGGISTYLDVDSTSATAATSGTDKDLFNSILTLGWTDCLTF